MFVLALSSFGHWIGLLGWSFYSLILISGGFCFFFLQHRQITVITAIIRKIVCKASAAANTVKTSLTSS